MNAQVHRLFANIKHNGTESCGTTEGEISSKLPLLLNSRKLGTERERENNHFTLPILT